MARAFHTQPAGPVLIVGADIPGLSRHQIAAAFTKLGTYEAVLGPAEDGGYYLIGLKRVRAQPPGLFSDVRWSTKHALSDTLRTLPGRVAMIERLRDVDTLADLQSLRVPFPA